MSSLPLALRVSFLQISALYGAMYLLESHVASVSAVLLPILTDFLSKKLNTLTGYDNCYLYMFYWLSLCPWHAVLSEYNLYLRRFPTKNSYMSLMNLLAPSLPGLIPVSVVLRD